MAKIFTELTQLIGNTPLVMLRHLGEAENLEAQILAKVESFNPGGSAKDRVALAMIEAAERSGQLAAGGTIIEPTSGNTGVGLAWVGGVRGYKTILTMPETMSLERQNLLRAMGAQLVLTSGKEGMAGAIAKAEEIHRATPNSVILGQFVNPANPEVHARTTAQEIWNDTDGNIDIFVAGVGTGGTISGTARGLKEHNPKICVVGVEPATSAVLSGQPAGRHNLQGIGAGFVPQNFHAQYVDQIMPITDDEAYAAARLAVSAEGLLVGISSGAALCAALKLARQPENKGKTIVALLPDTGERYLSTQLFS